MLFVWRKSTGHFSQNRRNSFVCLSLSHWSCDWINSFPWHGLDVKCPVDLRHVILHSLIYTIFQQKLWKVFFKVDDILNIRLWAVFANLYLVFCLSPFFFLLLKICWPICLQTLWWSYKVPPSHPVLFSLYGYQRFVNF